MIRKERPQSIETITNDIIKDQTKIKEVRKFILKYFNCGKIKTTTKKRNNINTNKKRKTKQLLLEIKKLSSSSSPTLTNFLLRLLIDGKRITCVKYLMKRKV